MTYRFGCYLLREHEQQLLREGETVAITSKVLTTLAVLVRAQGKVLTRNELLLAVWPDSFVERGSLAQNIFVLRKLLAPDFPAGNPIETLPRIGYRFRVPVEVLPEEEFAATQAMPKTAAGLMPTMLPRTGHKGMERDPGGRERVERAAEVDPSSPATGEPTRVWSGLDGTIQRSETASQVTAELGSAKARRAVWNVRMVWGAAAAGLLFAVFACLWAAGDLRAASGLQPVFEVTDFRNLTTDPAQAWIGVAAAEVVRSSLEAPAQHSALTWGKRSTNFSFLRLRRRPNDSVPVVLTGAFLLVGDELRLDAQLRIPGRNRSPDFFSVHGQASRLPEIAAALASEVRPHLNIPERGNPSDAGGQPLSPDGLHLYSEGSRALAQLDLPVARTLLTRAAQEDPRSAVVDLALAETWAQLGNASAARTAANRAQALDLSSREETRLEIQAVAATASGRRDEAVRLYLTLARCWPGDPAFGLDLAGSLHRALRDGEARRELSRLHNLSANEETRRQLLLCEIDGALSDFTGEAAAAQQIIAESRENGLPIPRARALMYEATAAGQLGNLETASRLFAQSESEAKVAGDAATVLRASIGHANLIAKMGQPAAAAEELQQMLAKARKEDVKPQQIECLLALGTVYRESKALNRSLAAASQALSLAQQLDSQRDIAAAYLSLGQTEIYLGPASKARESLDAALAQTTVDDVSLRITTLGALGVLDYMQGDLRTSSILLERAVQMDGSYGGREVAAHYMGRLSQVLSYQGKVDEANRVLNAWCAYEMSARNLLDLAGCELFQSQMREQAGHIEAARQEVETVLEASRDPLVTAEAHRQLALISLDQRDVSSAQRAIAAAEAESQEMINEEDYVIPIGIAAARVEAASGAVQPALAHLHILEQRAKVLGFTELVLEAEYTSDEIDFQVNPLQAAQELQTFQGKAEKAGFISFAEEANQILRGQERWRPKLTEGTATP